MTTDKPPRQEIHVEPIALGAAILVYLFAPDVGNWCREVSLLLATYMIVNRIDTWMLFWLGKQ